MSEDHSHWAPWVRPDGSDAKPRFLLFVYIACVFPGAPRRGVNRNSFANTHSDDRKRQARAEVGLMDAAMNHDSIIPLYAQVEEKLKRDIENGVYSKNGRIPTEAELAEQYKVSRITVRRAVEDLVSQGLVEKKQGKGTFVTAHKFSRRLDSGPMGFTEMCESIGLTPSAQNLKAEICVPKSAEIRNFLQLREREPAIHISRVRCGNSKPIAFEESYYPMMYSDLLSLDLEKESIYAYLRNVKGIELRSTTIRLSIVKADAKVARLLCVPRNAAQLEIKGFVIQPDGQPVHTSYQVGYGENFEFIVR